MKKTKKLVAVITLIAVIFGITACGNSESFWEQENILPLFLEPGESVEDEEMTRTVIDEERKIVDINPPELVKKVSKYNQEIENYFEQKGIDVSKKISSLSEIKVFEADSYKGNVLSGLVDETNNVWINKDIIQDEKKIQSVYVHEMMHYIGIEDNDCYFMAEGLADMVAKDIVGKDYREATMYEFTATLASQMLEADDDLLKEIIDGKVKISERINQRLEDIPTKYNFFEYKRSDILEVMCDSAVLGWEETEDNSFKVMLQAEYIIAAYCKTFELDDEKIKKLKDFSVVDLDRCILADDGIEVNAI